MDLGSILLIAALAVLAGAFIAAPILRNESEGVSAAEAAHSALLAERERILEALLELDFDHELGKVPEATYAEQRARLVSQGAQVLTRLDAVEAADDPIEALVAARRAQRSTSKK
jgi:hypothetical protein